MGKPTGFLEFSREMPPKRPVMITVNSWKNIRHKNSTSRLHVAWIAGYHFAIMDVRWEILFLSLMTRCTGKAGEKHTTYYYLPIIFLNSRDESALHPAKARVCLASTNPLLLLRKLKNILLK